jgi:hypothetical protein
MEFTKAFPPAHKLSSFRECLECWPSRSDIEYEMVYRVFLNERRLRICTFYFVAKCSTLSVAKSLWPYKIEPQ